MIYVETANGGYYDSDITNEASGIEDLDLRVIDYNYLRKLGFTTIGQLLEYDGWYYFNLPRHSLKAIELFILALDELGFRLKDASRERYPDIADYIAVFQQAEKGMVAEELKQIEREERAERRRLRKLAQQQIPVGG